MVDVNTIGAGGGSLAWIDGAGGLRVGPQSAGAEPGPACYGRGGDRPTVTDASVLLGYLNPENFAGGSLRLDVRAAERAVATVAGPLRLDAVAAAAGIHRVVNARMADQIRLMTIQRGHDPRGFTLVLLGGAGPVHGVALAEELGLADVLVPEAPGVLSALGLLAASVEHEHARTHPSLVEACRPRGRERAPPRAGRRRARAHAGGGRAGRGGRGRLFGRPALRRPGVRAAGAARGAARARRSRHGPVGLPCRPRAGLRLRADRSARGVREPPRGARLPPADPADRGRRRGRAARWPTPGSGSAGSTSRRPASPRRRSTRAPDLPLGAGIPGPAIVEQADTTTVVPPDWAILVEESGNLRIRRTGRG